WGDVGVGTNRTIMGIDSDMTRGGLIAEIDSTLRELLSMQVGDGTQFRDTATAVADNISRLHDGQAHSEAAAFALRELQLLLDKPHFEGKEEILSFISAIGSASNLEIGNVPAAFKLVQNIDPFTITKPDVRLRVLLLKLDVIRTGGGLNEYYSTL